MSATTTPVVTPLPVPDGSAINFGASVSNLDIENLTGKK